jgi:hypothetical protein
MRALALFGRSPYSRDGELADEYGLRPNDVDCTCGPRVLPLAFVILHPLGNGVSPSGVEPGLFTKCPLVAPGFPVGLSPAEVGLETTALF